MRHRFFVHDAGGPGTTVVLAADEAAHAARVLRLRPGAPVAVFDGRGHEFGGVVIAAEPVMEIRLDHVVAPAAEAGVAVTLAHAVLKGDKMDDVVRDAVMMGVAAIQPVVTRYCETTLALLARGRRLDRWRRVAVASAKQCGRAVVPDVREPCAFVPDGAWFDVREMPAPRLVLAEPHARAASPLPPASVPRPAPGRATLVVGPEGGWAPEEIRALEGAATAVTLGARTLRADVAAMVAVAALFAVWGE